MLRRTLRRAFSASPLLRSAGGFCFEMTSEQQMLQETARRFAKDVMAPQAVEYDLSMKYPQPLFEEAWKLGLLNLHIPAEYGGAGLSAMDGLIITEELAWACSGMTTAFEGNDLASAPVRVAGTPAQQKKYLGRLTEAPLQAAYAVTEPGAGSDVQGIKTTAEKKGDKWIINGSKMWITNGGVANWFFVLAKSKDGFCGFIVDGDSPGLVRGKKEINMGQRCSDTRGLTFENLVVPEENLLGKVGDGFKIAMKAFDLTRPPVAILATGVARRAYEEAKKYAMERKTFGKSIAEHQAIQFIIADMATGLDAARLLA